MKVRNFIHLFFLVILTTVIYWNALSYECPAGNAIVEVYASSQGIVKIFTSSLTGGLYVEGAMYRPIHSLTLYLAYILSGSEPLNHSIAYLLMNLIPHILAVLLVYFFALRLFKDKRTALLSGVIFSVWPGTMWIMPFATRQSVILMAVFILLALIFLDNYLKSKKRIWQYASVISGFLAYMSQGSSIVLIALVLFYIIFKGKGLSTKGVIRIYFPFVFALLFYLFIRLWVIGSAGGSNFERTLFETIISRAVLITSFFERLIYPIDILGLDRIILFYVNAHDISLLELLSFSIISLVGVYLLLRIVKSLPDWKNLFTTNKGFLLTWIMSFLVFYIVYGKVSMWYMYIAAVPFSILLSVRLLSLKGISRVPVLILILYFVVASPLFLEYSATRLGCEVKKELFPEIVESWRGIPGNSTVYLVNYPGGVRGHVSDSGVGIMATQGLLKMKYPERRWDFIGINFFEVKDANKKFSIGYSIERGDGEITILSEGENVEFRKKRIALRTEENGVFRERQATQRVDVLNVDESKQKITIKNFSESDYVVIFGAENSGVDISGFRVDEI